MKRLKLKQEDLSTYPMTQEIIDEYVDLIAYEKNPYAEIINARINYRIRFKDDKRICSYEELDMLPDEIRFRFHNKIENVYFFNSRTMFT